MFKSSLYYSRGNGKAESAIKIAKNILKKSRCEEAYLAVLAYRDTPQQGLDSSPAQHLMFRRLRGIIPTTTGRLAPQRVPSHVVLKNTSEKRKKSTIHYDNQTHQKSLHKGKRSISNPGPQIGLNNGFTER